MPDPIIYTQIPTVTRADLVNVSSDDLRDELEARDCRQLKGLAEEGMDIIDALVRTYSVITQASNPTDYQPHLCSQDFAVLDGLKQGLANLRNDADRMLEYL